MTDSTKTHSKRVVAVTRAQVEAARLRQDLLRSLGKPVDERTRRIAQVAITGHVLGEDLQQSALEGLGSVRSVSVDAESDLIGALRDYLEDGSHSSGAASLAAHGPNVLSRPSIYIVVAGVHSSEDAQIPLDEPRSAHGGH